MNPSLDARFRKTVDNLTFGTFALFFCAVFFFGVLGARRGVLPSPSPLFLLAAAVFAAHALARFAARVVPAEAAAFLLASLIAVSAVLASWSGGARSPALFLLAGLGFAAPFFFGRSGAFAATLAGAALLGPLGAYEPGLALTTALALVLFAFAASVFGAIVEESREAEERYRSALARALRSERVVSLAVLSAGFAHEVKNPVSGVLAYLDNWRREADEATKKRLDRIEAELRRTLSLVERAEGRQSRDAATARRFDLADVVGEVVELAAASGERRNVALEADAAPAPTVAREDEIRQAVLNLVANAVDFAKRRVRVTSRAVDGRVEVVVEDDGPGVDPTEAERLFEPFYTTRPEGTGMGLAVVSAVARNAGGRIEAGRSADLGGARFVLSLPAAEAAEAKGPTA